MLADASLEYVTITAPLEEREWFYFYNALAQAHRLVVFWYLRFFVTTTMATRIAARYVSRRLSSSGKVLSEEERAAENVYIKKMEQERLAKAARKGPQAEEIPIAGSGGPAADAAATGSSSSTSNVSTDKYRNYAVVAGTVTVLGAIGWYLKGSKKAPEEVQD